MKNESLFQIIQSSMSGTDMSGFLSDIGAGGLNEESKKQMESKIQSILEKRIILRLADLIDEKDMDQMANMNNEDVLKYLDEKGINLLDIGAEEGLKFREEMIENMGYVQGLIDAKKDQNK